MQDMILNTKYLENCKSALKPCGISGFPWWAPGRVKYYDDVDKKAKCRYNKISFNSTRLI